MVARDTDDYDDSDDDDDDDDDDVADVRFGTTHTLARVLSLTRGPAVSGGAGCPRPANGRPSRCVTVFLEIFGKLRSGCGRCVRSTPRCAGCPIGQEPLQEPFHPSANLRQSTFPTGYDRPVKRRG